MKSEKRSYLVVRLKGEPQLAAMDIMASSEEEAVRRYCEFDLEHVAKDHDTYVVMPLSELTQYTLRFPKQLFEVELMYKKA